MAMVIDLVERGGWVMVILLGLSVVAVAAVLERGWFWLVTCRGIDLVDLADALRTPSAGLPAGRHPLARLARRLRSRGTDDATTLAAVERERSRLERFMTLLSTVITAAPMLGILGTVTGIIDSFGLLSASEMATDPRAVSGGIAEALLTTATGLVIALLVLFPYAALRAAIDRMLGRFEVLVAAARSAEPEASSASRSGEAARRPGNAADAER